jgi:hypothetical protein
MYLYLFRHGLHHENFIHVFKNVALCFRDVSEILIMVPALLGLKGNLEMTLASRLSTAANMGHLDRWVTVIRYTLDERLAPLLVPRRLLRSSLLQEILQAR